MTPITLDRVTKRYGHTTAINDLSFSVASGEMFGLIGPDGAGKTTAIRLICGLLKADAGRVRVLDLDPVLISSSDPSDVLASFLDWTEFRRARRGVVA